MRPDVLQQLDVNRRGRVGRRELLKSVVALTGGYTAAHLFLANSALAAMSPAQETQSANVDVETVHYPSEESSIEAYLAKPKGTGTFPAVMVIHENRGLTDQFRDVTRRFAAAGFIAMAPDLLSRVGGMAKMDTPADATRALNQLPPDATVNDLKAGFDFLSKYSGVDAAKVSVVGFAWGSWRTFLLAEAVPNIYRAVVFYGSTPTDGLQNIHAPVLAHYAQFDFRTTGNAILIQDTMKKLGKKFTYYVYPNTYSTFFDDMGTQRYDADASKLAWTRTLDFLRSNS